MSTRDERKYNGETVQRGSGNVFQDLELPNPEERLAKAQLIEKVGEIVHSRNLSQKEVAKLLGIDQPKVSKLLRGRISEFATSTLLEYLTQLGQTVEIHVKPSREAKEAGILVVLFDED